jgi:hypothetical protein
MKKHVNAPGVDWVLCCLTTLCKCIVYLAFNFPPSKFPGHSQRSKGTLWRTPRFVTICVRFLTCQYHGYLFVANIIVVRFRQLFIITTFINFWFSYRRQWLINILCSENAVYTHYRVIRNWLNLN